MVFQSLKRVVIATSSLERKYNIKPEDVKWKCMVNRACSFSRCSRYARGAKPRSQGKRGSGEPAQRARHYPSSLASNQLAGCERKRHEMQDRKTNRPCMVNITDE